MEISIAMMMVICPREPRAIDMRALSLPRARATAVALLAQPRTRSVDFVAKFVLVCDQCN